jgi:hypothetical protein
LFHALNLKVKKLDDLLAYYPDLEVNLRNWNADLRAGDIFDSFIFAAIVRSKCPQSYFEIGTGFGRSAMLAAANTPASTKTHSLEDEKLDKATLNQIESIVQKIEDREVRKSLADILIKGAKLEQSRKKSK